MLDRIHNLPITGLYEFSERYKLVKRTGDDLERDKLIEKTYRAIRAIEAGNRQNYLEHRFRLEGKIGLGPNGARIFYDRKSRTTRTFNDLILAHTTPEVAADAFMANEFLDDAYDETLHIWCRRDRVKWRRDASEAMLLFRCKRIIQRPDFDDDVAKKMMAWNAWIKPRCEAELAAAEAQEIAQALHERDSLHQQRSKQATEDEAAMSDIDLLLSPWLTAGIARSANQSVVRL